MRHQIPVVIIQFDTCLLTEWFEHVSSGIGRDRRWRDIDFDTRFDERLVLFELLDLCLSIATAGERLGNSLKERWAMEGWDDWIIWIRSVENVLVGFEGMDNWLMKTSVVEALLLREYGYVAVFEMDIFLTGSLAALIAPVVEDFRSSNPRV